MDLGGAETFAMHVYRNIGRAGIQFDFAVSAAKTCSYDSEINALGGRIIRHSLPTKAGLAGFAVEFARLLRQYGPFAAVHSHLHSFSGYLCAIAAREKVPIRIAHFHSTRDARQGTVSGFAYHAAMRFLLKRFATHILGCSENVLVNSFGTRWPRDPRISVLQNGIALEPFAALRQDRAGLRRRFSIPTDGPVLGHVGNFTRAKNHKFLIELFRSYRQNHPAAILVLAGDGDLRADIERLIEESGVATGVRILGRLPQAAVPDLLASFDALLMPSIYEGLPVALVEAQAAGVPCVVSDAITSAADLNLGLLRFVSLSAPLEEWRHQITRAIDIPRPDWSTRRYAIRHAGYDCETSSARLADIYRGGYSPPIAASGGGSVVPSPAGDAWK